MKIVLLFALLSIRITDVQMVIDIEGIRCYKEIQIEEIFHDSVITFISLIGY